MPPESREGLQEIATLLEGDRPVVLGPWSAEVGFELLYWIPFLRSALARAGVDRTRVTVISRGGVSSWYDGLGTNYIDIFDQLSAQDFRSMLTARQQGSGQKQMSADQWDHSLVRYAADRLGLADPVVLHPSLMNKVLRPYWLGWMARKYFDGHMDFRKLAPLDRGPLSDLLPGHYTAVRFYDRPSFPLNEANSHFVRDLLGSLMSRGKVVLLGTPFQLDDHQDYELYGKDLIRIDDRLTPANNLDLQSRAIANADRFIGTYGGFSYLAPLYGVPSYAFSSAPDQFVTSHLELAVRVFDQLGSDFIHMTTRQALDWAGATWPARLVADEVTHA